MVQERGKSYPAHMLAARLHGPSDLRIDQVPHPGRPASGQVLLRLKVTGLCGSDLHSYLDARIGDTRMEGPFVIGHEFSGVIEEAGKDSLDGNFQAIKVGQRVAVDPAQPCERCELCTKGHPNLCRHLKFCGNYPDGGSLCQWMHMPARCCFPVPDAIDDVSAAMLEPLGVAIHALDLARIRAAESVAILGAGPIGLLILQLAKLGGADPIFVTDRLPWRLELARKFGGIPINFQEADPARLIRHRTDGLGAHVAIEAAWAEESVAQAAEVVRAGGRVILVGIPSDDRLMMKHSTARRKGLTIALSRRMKHTYPRALRLVEGSLVDVRGLVSHHFPLERAAEAFELNTQYRDNVTKVIIDIERQTNPT